MLEHLNEADRHVLMLILEDLKDKVQELDVLLKDYLPAEDVSSGRKLMKAMGSFGAEKKIGKIVKAIFERYMLLLNFATIDSDPCNRPSLGCHGGHPTKSHFESEAPLPGKDSKE
jgi:hypothetical protein